MDKLLYVWVTILSVLPMMVLANESQKEPFKVFDATAMNERAPVDRAMLVFYRPAEGDVDAQLPVNIYLAGQYLASLLPGGQSMRVVCPGEVKVSSLLDSPEGVLRKEIDDAATDYTFGRGSTYYVAVRQVDGQVMLQVRNAEEAALEREGLKWQVHTVQRVVDKGCAQAAPVTPPPVVTELHVDGVQHPLFFQFDSERITPEGELILSHLVSKAKAKYQAITRVEVMGYTDPMGSEVYNQALSKMRAIAIMDALKKVGLKAEDFYVEGRGTQDLLVPDCAAQHQDKVKIKQCNAPNRRAVIRLIGTEVAK